MYQYKWKDLFQSLKMNFKESSRTHQVRKDNSKSILVSAIKFKENIEQRVNKTQETFNNCLTI